MRQVKISE